MKSNSKTLIDNAFSNAVSPNIVSGNLISSSSDHLPQFLIASSIFLKPSSLKSNIFEENSILDYLSIDWDQTLGIDKSSFDMSFKNFLDRCNSLLASHAPYEKLSKYKLKFRERSWITSGIQKSISIKNHCLSKFIKLKERHIRTEAQNIYRKHRNLISALLKRST